MFNQVVHNFTFTCISSSYSYYFADMGWKMCNALLTSLESYFSLEHMYRHDQHLAIYTRISHDVKPIVGSLGNKIDLRTDDGWESDFYEVQTIPCN